MELHPVFQFSYNPLIVVGEEELRWSEQMTQSGK
jgi:hypothetical protein